MTEQTEVQASIEGQDATVEGSVANIGAGLPTQESPSPSVAAPIESAAFTDTGVPASLSPFDPSSGTVSHDESQGGNEHAGANPADTQTEEIAPTDAAPEAEIPVADEVDATPGAGEEPPATDAETIDVVGDPTQTASTVDEAADQGQEVQADLQAFEPTGPDEDEGTNADAQAEAQIEAQAEAQAEVTE